MVVCSSHDHLLCNKTESNCDIVSSFLWSPFPMAQFLGLDKLQDSWCHPIKRWNHLPTFPIDYMSQLCIVLTNRIPVARTRLFLDKTCMTYCSKLGGPRSRESTFIKGLQAMSAHGREWKDIRTLKQPGSRTHSLQPVCNCH